ncbi:MAG: radical SAM protein [Deltaproteobacteria bacterium]|nr:radical SAM protein [Deltaproteobacteria bacterium]MBI3293755.1 radical SAM protein [Deltaproteobacteria bacterium]
MESPSIKINEIFFSIQGESLLVGKPTVFVRTAFCNLRCTWCDTKYAYWDGKVMTVDEVMKAVKGYDTEYVCVTGGEPLSQKGTYDLLESLLVAGYTVSLETNGSISIKDVPKGVIKVVDIKCPASGASEKMAWENLELVQPTDQLKFVVASRADFDWAQDVCQRHGLHKKCHILFSPSFEQVSPKELAEWIISSEAKVTMQMQMHKQIWGSDERGV